PARIWRSPGQPAALPDSVCADATEPVFSPRLWRLFWRGDEVFSPLPVSRLSRTRLWRLFCPLSALFWQRLFSALFWPVSLSPRPSLFSTLFWQPVFSPLWLSPQARPLSRLSPRRRLFSLFCLSRLPSVSPS